MIPKFVAVWLFVNGASRVILLAQRWEAVKLAARHTQNQMVRVKIAENFDTLLNLTCLFIFFDLVAAFALLI